MTSRFAACLKGRCPACHQGRVFAGVLRLRARCEHCAFAVDDRDRGDALAYPGVLVVGCVVGGLAAALERVYAPPLWVHALAWVPLTVLLCLAVLRLGRAAYLYATYHHPRDDHTASQAGHAGLHEAGEKEPGDAE